MCRKIFALCYLCVLFLLLLFLVVVSIFNYGETYGWIEGPLNFLAMCIVIGTFLYIVLTE